MTKSEFYKKILEKERELVALGIDPKKLTLVIPKKTLELLEITLTPNTRFQSFYGTYPIEVEEMEDENPKFSWISLI